MSPILSDAACAAVFPGNGVFCSAAGIVRAAGQVVQRDPVQVRQPDRGLKRQRPFAPLIFRVERLVAEQERRYLLLGQVGVLPQVSDPQLHCHHHSNTITKGNLSY